MDIIKKLLDFFNLSKKTDVDIISEQIKNDIEKRRSHYNQQYYKCELCNSDSLIVRINDFGSAVNFYFCPVCLDFDTTHDYIKNAKNLLCISANIFPYNKIGIKQIVGFYCFDKFRKDKENMI